MFLADVVAVYVESLTEREFDAPIYALLKYLGFDNVHLIHGQFEFGQDFVAQRVENGTRYQYCLQSKAGDIGIGDWRAVRPQIDEMRTGMIAHPNYDPNLPRRLVLITNGRLVGAAPATIQMYNNYYADRNEAIVEFWGVESLLQHFESILVEGVPAVERARTLELLGRLELGTSTRREVHTYARAWFTTGSEPRDRWANHVTSAMLSRAATNAGREDLAAQVTLLLLRAAYENPADNYPSPAELASARRLFQVQAERVWDLVQDNDVRRWTLQSATGIDLFVTHPVRVARLCESLALLGLLAYDSGDADDADAIADMLERILHETPALSHLVSGEWAFSLLVTVTLLLLLGRLDSAHSVLREAAVWLLDVIEYGHGIVDAGEDAATAVRQLLGPPYAGIPTSRTRSAYTFTVVLDLAYVGGFRTLYEDLLNDIDAVDAFGSIIIENHPSGGTRLVGRVDYQSTVPPAEHYGIPADTTDAGKNQRWFDCFARWATLRDRHQPAVLFDLLAEQRPERENKP